LSRQALFLDRDGVINIDRGYVYRQEDFEFVDGIFDLCRHAKQLGYLLFVVTNQAGIGRGLFTEDEFLSLTAWMTGVFEDQGAAIAKVYYSPYHPDHGIGRFKLDSPLRKPRPGMLLRAAREFSVNLSRSLSVGDQESDVQAGIAAGVALNLLYYSPVTAPIKSSAATAIVRSLNDVVPFLDQLIVMRARE